LTHWYKKDLIELNAALLNHLEFPNS
jgi:hypothetical protein